MPKAIRLLNFTPKEILLDEQETRLILTFFFPQLEQQIELMIVDHRTREFAQGLLVEAIDASYRMGFVEAIARASANPMRGATKTIKNFGKHAFKEALVQACNGVQSTKY